MRILSQPPEPCFFFQEPELANIGYGTLIHFKNITYLQYFAILLDNNIVVAIKYLKTMITFLKNL